MREEEEEEVMGPLFCNRVFNRLARAVFVLDVTRAELAVEGPAEQVMLEALLTLLNVPDLGDDKFDELRFSPLLGLLLFDPRPSCALVGGGGGGADATGGCGGALG